MTNILLNSFAFLGTQELLIVAFVVLLLFGGAKIPSLMRGLGRGMGEFQKGINEGKKNFDSAMQDASSDTDSTTSPTNG